MSRGGIDVLLAAARMNLDLSRRNTIRDASSLARELKRLAKDLEEGESPAMTAHEIGERAVEIGLSVADTIRYENLVRELETIR